MLVKIVNTVVATDSAGNPVDAIPVREWVEGETSIAGVPLAAVQLEESDVGVPVRFVVGKTAQNSAGQWVDTIPTTGGGAPSNAIIPYNTPIVVIGPSIQNVVNTRSPRMHLMSASSGHFYPTPGNNQAVGGACATIEGSTGSGTPNNYYEEPGRIDMVMKQLGDPTKRGKVLVLYDPGPNDIGKSGVTAQKMIDAMDRWIARVTAAGHWIALAAINESGATATDSVKQAVRTAFNTALASRLNPTGGIFTCTSRLAAFDANYSALSIGDGLHPRAAGAMLIGYADWNDLKAYCDFTNTIWKDAASYVNPFGQSANAKGAFSGSGGTAGTGASGQVADGWSVYASSNGQSGGSLTGVLATCSVASGVSIVVNGKTLIVNRQRIRFQGTASAAGVGTLIGAITKGAGAAQYFNWMEFGQVSFLHRIYGSAEGVAPGSMRGYGTLYGLLGSMMNKTIETQAGKIEQDTGVVAHRTVPVQSLKLNGAQNAELSVAWSNGEVVDITVDVYQMFAEQVETAAYGPLFNLSAAFASGVTNPITRRPDLTGTKTVGQTITLTPPCLAGGGLTSATSYIKDAANNNIATFSQTANPSTYVLQAGDSGKTIRNVADVANSYGPLTVDDGPTYAVA